MRFAFYAIIPVFLLSGCVTLNQTEYISADDADESVSRIDWDDDYQVVYEKIIKATETCLKPGASNGYKVDQDMSSDAKEGTITVTMKSLDGHTSKSFMITVKQKPLPNQALVMVYARRSNWKKIATTWVEVLSRGSASCLGA